MTASPSMNKVLLAGVKMSRPFDHFTPPLGLLYLAAVLKNEAPEIDVTVVDQRISRESNEAFAERVLSGGYGIVGLSSFTGAARNSAEIARALRRRSDAVRILIGGPHACAYPEDALKEGAFDAAVTGEGEPVIAELLRRLAEKKDLSGLAGVALRRDSGIIRGPAPEIVEDLDALPFPAWEKIDPSPYWKREGFAPRGKRPYFPIFSSRGCPYGCTYCHRIFGKRFRKRSPENVLSEMKSLHLRYGVSEFEFIDDAFNLDEERALLILERIRREIPKPTLLFPNGLRGDVLSERLIDALAAAGTNYISFAVESASDRHQKLIKKNLDLAKTKENIRQCAKRGIFCNGYFMLGFPGETPQEMEETVSFALGASLHSASFFLVKAFKGTSMYESLSPAQREKVDRNADSMIYDLSTVNVSAASDAELSRLHRRALLRFYLRPRAAWRMWTLHPRPSAIMPYFIKTLWTKIHLNFASTGRTTIKKASAA